MSGPIPRSVVVVGGGLAGLTAAYRLACHGARVTLIDRRATLGGNALPPGQGWESSPLTVSACHQDTSGLLRALGLNIRAACFSLVPLGFLRPDGTMALYPYTPLPRKLSLAVSLIRFAGLTWRERWRLVSWLEQIWEGAIQLPLDLAHRTADEWLAALGQGDQARRTVWEPLAQWLTGNETRSLSADAFRRAIESTFLCPAGESRWTIIPSLHASLVQPMIKHLTRCGATFLVDTEAAQLLSDGDRVTGVLLKNGSILQGEWYLAALPPRQLGMLLPERWLSRYAYFQQLVELGYVPTTHAQVIITRPLVKPRILLLSQGYFRSMVALPTGSGHTVCKFSGGDERAVVLNTSKTLQAAVEEVLRSLNLLSPGHHVVSFDSQRYAEGSLSLQPGVQARRPLQCSPIANLLVAGAWTDTGWPANVESAIVSANRCAEIISESPL